MTQSSSLVDAFTTHPLGLCGQHDPARVLADVEPLERRVNLLAFGAVVSTTPLSQQHWTSLTANRDSWLFDPSQVAYQPSPAVSVAIQNLNIGAPGFMGRVWWQICRGVQGRFKGSWRSLFQSNADDTQRLLGFFGQSKAAFPVLSGPVISPRWLDLVHRIGGIPLSGWESLTVPLAPGQSEAASAFGITGQEVHPLVSAALSTWSAACQSLLPDSCGFPSCPRRQ